MSTDHQQPTARPLFTPADATPFSTDESAVIPWAEAQRCIEEAPQVWLSTGRPDGRPHTMVVLAVWLDGAVCFATRPSSRKGRNLAASPYATVAIGCESLDLVVEGHATPSTDPSASQRILDALAEKYGWRLTLDDDRVRDDHLPGSPEYALYRVVPTTAFGFGADGDAATRWAWTS